MAVSFVAATTFNSTGNVASTPVNKPSGVAAGDLMIAHAVSMGTAFSLTGGWTLLRTDISPAGCRSRIFYRVAGTSEPSTYTASDDNLNGAVLTLSIVAYRGGSIGAHGWSGGTSTTPTAPSVTAAKNGLAVRLFSMASTASITNTPGGQTQRFAGADSEEITRGLDAPVAAGATGTVVLTLASSKDWNAQTVVVASNNTAPNAPTLTSPASNATIDRGIVQRFAWTFSDPDAGDSQSKFNLYYRLVGAPSWTTVTQTVPNTFYDFAAGTFAPGNYEWQVETYDAQGVLGARSASSFFTAADAPAQPTITAPVSGATVSSSAAVTWSAPNQTDYQIRRVRDNAGNPDTATVYYDSGDVVTNTARSQTLTFDTNNRFEHIQVRIKNNGLWSAWTTIRVQVSYTPPTKPVVSLLADDDAGSLVVTVTNPAPGAGVPATAYNDVYVDDGNGEERKASMLAPNTSWTYWTPVALRDYAGHVRVVAVATNGTTASS